MNYYKHHLGDYAKDTRHLSMLEHGAYRLLLDHYYATEKPIPDHLCERITNARTGAERKAVRSVLEQFFTKLNGSWFSSKCEEIIGESFSKSRKASESARARWEANQPMRTHSERNADAMLATTPLLHKPEDQELSTSLRSVDVGFCESAPVDPSPAEKPKKPKRNPVPFTSIVDLYHESLPMLPRVEKLTETRKGYLRQRWEQDLPDLDHWRNYFTFVSRSPFLTGKSNPAPGKPPFRADLEWITRPGNYAKIAEEKYHHG